MVRFGARGIALGALLAMACDGAPAPDAGVPDASMLDGDLDLCARDSDCGDQSLFCARPRCMIGEPGADARGCIDLGSPCELGQECDEDEDACGQPLWCTDGRAGCARPGDCDGDNSRHELECGGDDCDDDDGNRFPDNPEVCDASHDEDCDPETFGTTDADGDTFVSDACCNGDACAPDCDDGDVNVNPGAVEVCDGIDNDCDGSIDMAEDPLCPGGMCTGGRCSFTGWDRTLGAASLDDYANSVAMDGAGNAYVAGTFRGTVNAGGTTYTAAGQSDAFVLSYDPAGSVRWFTPIGTSSTDSVGQVTVGPTGTVFVSGSLGVNHFDFGGGERTNAGSARLPFVVALRADTGVYIWDRTFDQPPAISATDDGGVVVAANHQNAVDVGGTAPVPAVGATGPDLHLIRYAADGSYSWDARYGGTGTVFADDVATGGDSIVVAGGHLGSVDLGDGTTPAAMVREYYVASYSLMDGSFEWARSYTTAGFQSASGIATDGANVYVVGTNQGTVTFEPGVSHTASTAVELWLLALTAAGDYRWHATHEATVSATARDVDLDPAGGAVFAGHFTGMINLGGGAFRSTRLGEGPSGFVAFFDDEGRYVSDRPFAAGPEASSAVYFEDVVAGPGGNVAVVGQFEGSADFGAGDRVSSGFDIVTLRLAR